MNYLVPMLPSSATTLQNTSAKSTPLHWATVNRHLEVAKRIVEISGSFSPPSFNLRVITHLFRCRRQIVGCPKLERKKCDNGGRDEWMGRWCELDDERDEC